MVRLHFYEGQGKLIPSQKGTGHLSRVQVLRIIKDAAIQIGLSLMPLPMNEAFSCNPCFGERSIHHLGERYFGPWIYYNNAEYLHSRPEEIAGVLDGRNHVLRNFHVKTEMGKAGGNRIGNLVNPFNKVPEIKYLYLENFTIEGEGLRNAAALLMHNAGGRTINVHVSATISGEDTLGGIVAINAGKILNSSLKGTIQGSKIVGGIVGKSHEFSIENCKVSGKISGESFVGGIVGELSKASHISDNEVEAEATGKEDFGKLLGKVTP